MLITEKLGNINATAIGSHTVDIVVIEWHETNKRILHKKTKLGIDVTMKFLQEGPHLEEGDILWNDKNSIIVVEINPCECIVVTPQNMLMASSICYEIGNRHLPLFYEGDDLLVPYEVPLHNLLEASGYPVRVEERKLNHAVQTTVLPHLQVAGTGSIFSKILQLTTTS